MISPFVKPAEKDVQIDFWEWSFPFDENKSLKQNAIENAEVVARECLDMDFEFSFGGDSDEPIDGQRLKACVCSEAGDNVYLHFDVMEAARAALQAAITNYHPRWRDERMSEIKSDLESFRAAFSEVVSLCDEALGDPNRFCEAPEKEIE